MPDLFPPALAGYPRDRIHRIAAKAEGTRWDGYAHHDLYFAAWLKITDTILRTTVGVGLLELPDAPYRDWYDHGVAPADAAVDALRSDDLLAGLATTTLI